MQWKLIQVQGEFRRLSSPSGFDGDDDDDDDDDDDSVPSAAVSARLAIQMMQYAFSLHPA